ncbi:MAG: sugar kinase [Candidatus Freyarchaeota archaeon]|nr:sugar kinase [Candidatus Jordarchaeia archaeon]
MDVVCLGEIIADFVPVGERTFKVCFGGAPMNTAIACARLGLRAAAIAAVGRDPLGEFLLDTLKSNNVNVGRVRVTGYRTTLAFVSRLKGENAFFFYRRPWVVSADTELGLDEEDLALASEAAVFHFTGLPLSHRPLREDILEIVGELRKRNVTVSFDPTYRPDSWGSREEAREATLEAASNSDALLATTREYSLLFGETGVEEIFRECRKLGVKVVGVKMGERGSALGDRSSAWLMEAYPVEAVDTVGAGDAWNAGVIYGLIKNLSLSETIKIANATAALKCTAHGAVDGLPTLDQVKNFLEKHKHEPRQLII